MILPLGTRSGKFGKWSPSWDGPFRVIRVVPSNAYFMEDLEGHSLPRALNGKHLKMLLSYHVARPIKEVIVSRRIGGAERHGRLRVIIRCKREKNSFGENHLRGCGRMFLAFRYKLRKK
jgi:hypothetical protein